MEDPDAPQVFLTSDWHLGHRNIIGYCHRPFDTVERMNWTIVENHNAVVRPQDTVFVLGDLALGKIEESLSFVEMMNGRIVMLSGNHDRIFSGRKRVKATDRALYTDVGIEIADEQRPLVIDNTHFGLMCHFPYHGDSHDADRFVEQRPVDRGGWVFHGHVHNAWRVRGRQINVGVDVNDFTPVHVSKIVEIMDAA